MTSFWKTARADLSPFAVYSAQEWSTLSDGRPAQISEKDLRNLLSVGDATSLSEVDQIYLTVSRILAAHARATRRLYKKRASFLPHVKARTPFIIAIAGSVAVGKSTTARLIQELIRRWPNKPRVDLVTTDGWLYPNAELERRGIMHRKGFPESYDRQTMLRFLSDVKSGQTDVAVPVYSHLKYDIDPDAALTISQPDVLIFEGLNVLQSRTAQASDTPTPLASDHFDFKIYVDAYEPHIKSWYINRFLSLRETAFRDPNSHFNRWANLTDSQATDRATDLWDTINAVNLSENIRPTRPRADLILRKGEDHQINRIALRRL
ncbi:type I pantothenate kinase [Amylibacter sp. IMCC11727]|uniref:type I pantothenate kinase n=1 Tax=Amylibacter sp. IMCC11727 TaxID=3039851 RepID=UPI00244DAB19|nr:type I pantothenate kinase [Amylibacter sp. IMCC11727]WGI21640.1 type I pantothenate kinase [Amylibacter sp. IMCC11727]